MDFHPNDIKATRFVVTVGDGRGFITKTSEGNLIVTAAHCLPSLPEALSFHPRMEKTYRGLVKPLTENESGISAELRFVDPISDLAVLQSPDDCELPRDADAFEKLTEWTRLSIDYSVRDGRGWLLSLANVWLQCDVIRGARGLMISNVEQAVAGGMSGSPILSFDGQVLGVIVAATENGSTEHGPNPCLALDLPAALVLG